MKKRMREKLALDIKSGRIKSHHLLQAFDHQMMNWIGEELGKKFNVELNMNTKDHKTFKNLNLWENIDILSDKQISLFLNPLNSVKIMKRVTQAVHEQMIQQNIDDIQRQIIHDEIKQMFCRQINRNKYKMLCIDNTFHESNTNNKSVKVRNPKHMNTE
eukprot:354342_1